MRRRIVVLAFLLVPVLAAGDQGKGKGRGKHKGDSYATQGSPVGVSIFVDDDRRIVHDYYARHPGGGLPPGLAKRAGALPPGLEKHLRRNGRLPPGLEKKLYYFPPDLEARLPPVAPGLRRGFIEGRAVIFNPRTSVILDVFVPLD